MTYTYTLDDLYTIFRESNDKVKTLKEFQALNLQYNINWDKLIKVWSHGG